MRCVKTKVGQEGNIIVFALFLTGTSLLLVKFIPWIWMVVAFVAIHEFGRGVFAVAIDSFVQHRVESSYRATFGSLQSFIAHIGLALVPLIVWVALTGKPNTSETIEMLWFISGAIMAGVAILFFLFKPKDVCATEIEEE